MLELIVKRLNDNARNFYSSNENQMNRGESGYDLYYCGEDIYVMPNSGVVMLDMGIACQPTTPHGYYLYPRSSISKTPLIMANCVGIIDIGYRGEIKCAVKNISSNAHIVKTGDKLFQLCMHDLSAFKVTFSDELTNTVRGEGGFGSTG